ncbi:hypothetical protein [Nocardioides ferulae]|uniref:hypothetical protein n=1 Tax=Nocardioides ferulae TaxID=2340821 RepID=UPI000F893CFD|nr:hypothetical protein [Nocardioides ferulae]
MADPAWAAWATEHVDRERYDFVIYFEDREKPRIVIRGDTASYYVPAHTLAKMPRPLRIQGRELFYQLYKRWAEKKGLPAPPEV